MDAPEELQPLLPLPSATMGLAQLARWYPTRQASRVTHNSTNPFA